MKITEEEKMEYINKLDKYIRRLVSKFVYYTKLDNDDLYQEAVYKILEILKAYEDGELEVDSKENMIKLMNKSILHYMINLIRDFPSYEVIENSIDNVTDDLLSNEEDFTMSHVYDLLENPDLSSSDGRARTAIDNREIILLLVLGYTQKQIAELFDVSQVTINKRINKIRETWEEMHNGQG